MQIAHVAAFAGLIGTARADGALDIEQAMKLSASRHPAVTAHQARIAGADARVEVERARFWPDVELFAQLDRSTSNTSSGALFAVPGLPVVSGAPGRKFDLGAFGTAAGVTASWDALGYRRWDAQIDAAQAEARAVRVDAAVTELELAYAAADRFIVVIVRDESVTAARAGVDRARVFVTTVNAAVDQNLRPGADLSRAQAELSLAETAVIRAEAASHVALAQLAEALGAPGQATAPQAGKLRVLPQRPTLASLPSASDPRLVEVAARIDAARARKAAIETGTLPKVALVGALWGRANGNDTGGLGLDGLVPDVPNWALGVAVAWPVFAGKLVDPQARVEAANIAHDEARAQEISQHEQAQIAQAMAILDGAYRVAASTPVALKAARDAEQQATARYQAKLATADDVAQAQRLLQQAEIDDAVARLEVWHAILDYAYALGDLSRFTAAYDAGGD